MNLLVRNKTLVCELKIRYFDEIAALQNNTAARI